MANNSLVQKIASGMLILACGANTGCEKAVHYRTPQCSGQIIQEQAEELTLPLKYIEPGNYRVIVERKDACDFIGEGSFTMMPATPGYIIPNEAQTTSWKVVRGGVFDVYAGGNDWRLKLGRVKLDAGDTIKFLKNDSQPAYQSPVYPGIMPQ